MQKATRRSLPLLTAHTHNITIHYSTLQYSTVQYSAVQYSTVQYSTVQYSAATLQLTADTNGWPTGGVNYGVV